MRGSTLIPLILLVALAIVVGAFLWYQWQPEELGTETVPAASFEEEGVIVFDQAEVPPYEMTFIYDDGTRALQLDEKSMCATPGGELPCVAMSVTLDLPFGNKPVKVTGIDDGTTVTVSRLEALE